MDVSGANASAAVVPSTFVSSSTLIGSPHPHAGPPVESSPPPEVSPDVVGSVLVLSSALDPEDEPVVLGPCPVVVAPGFPSVSEDELGPQPHKRAKTNNFRTRAL